VRVPPADVDSKAALETLKALSTRGDASEISLHFRNRRSVSQNVRLPPLALKLSIEILKQIALGNAVSIAPLRKELTTYEAAEILNVSRPFVIGLLEKGKIPFRRVGTHRRIPLSALLECKRKTDAVRDARGYRAARDGRRGIARRLICHPTSHNILHLIA